MERIVHTPMLAIAGGRELIRIPCDSRICVEDAVDDRFVRVRWSQHCLRVFAVDLEQHTEEAPEETAAV